MKRSRIRAGLATRSGSLRRHSQSRPIATLALAPFAGVLLTVTLVFAALRPPVTHALTVDLPLPNPTYLGPLTPNANRLHVKADGQLLWNSYPVDDAQFELILAQIRELSPQPVLMFDPAADAPYEVALDALSKIHRADLVDNCFRFDHVSRYRRYEVETPDQLVLAEPVECTIPYGY